MSITVVVTSSGQRGRRRVEVEDKGNRVIGHCEAWHEILHTFSQVERVYVPVKRHWLVGHVDEFSRKAIELRDNLGKGPDFSRQIKVGNVLRFNIDKRCLGTITNIVRHFHQVLIQACFALNRTGQSQGRIGITGGGMDGM